MSGREKKRKRVAVEILDTERSYVRDLTTLVEVFIEPLRTLVSEGLFGHHVHYHLIYRIVRNSNLREGANSANIFNYRSN